MWTARRTPIDDQHRNVAHVLHVNAPRRTVLAATIGLLVGATALLVVMIVLLVGMIVLLVGMTVLLGRAIGGSSAIAVAS